MYSSVPAFCTPKITISFEYAALIYSIAALAEFIIARPIPTKSSITSTANTITAAALNIFKAVSLFLSNPKITLSKTASEAMVMPHTKSCVKEAKTVAIPMLNNEHTVIPDSKLPVLPSSWAT